MCFSHFVRVVGTATVCFSHIVRAAFWGAGGLGVSFVDDIEFFVQCCVFLSFGPTLFHTRSYTRWQVGQGLTRFPCREKGSIFLSTVWTTLRRSSQETK